MTSEPVVLRSLEAHLAARLFLPETEAPVPALIVCHGAGEFKENYFELCACLAEKGVAAVAVDMHGHGESGGERFHVDMAEWVPDVRAALDFLSTHPRIDAGKIGAFGLSSGGTAIFETALIDGRLRALVALDATVRNSLPWHYAAFMKGLIFLGQVKKFFTRRELRLPLLKLFGTLDLVADPELNVRLQSNPKAVEAFMAFPFPGASQSFFVNTIKQVSKIKAPTLVIWGEEDKLDPPETAHLLYEALGCKKQLHIIPGNGHAGHLDRNRDKVFALTTDWALENLA